MPAKRTTRTTDPKAGRPYMPGYGIATGRKGLLPWKWAIDRLEAARNYWVVSTRPDGTPHTQAVWGVWIDNVFYFSTSETSRKAKNLVTRPTCSVAVEATGNETVVVDGEAFEERGARAIKKFVAAYEPKYEWKMDPIPGGVYGVRPLVVLGIGAEPFEQTATRWTFER